MTPQPIPARSPNDPENECEKPELRVVGEPDHTDTLSGDRSRIVAEVIHRRRSTRRYANRRIDPDVLSQLITAGIDAPSGSNWQNQRFLLVTEREEIDRIGRHRWVWPYRSSARDRNPSGIMGGAAALIIVFADAAANDFRAQGEYHIWEPLEIQNAAASIQNICLMATALGVANCWVSASEAMSNTRLLSKRRWRDVLGNYEIPATCKIQGIVCLGHPIKTDDQGYPMGEKKHGATVWSSTERRPMSHYMIKTSVDSSDTTVSRSTIAKLTVLSQLARLTKKILRRIDRRIEKIERRALSISYQRDPDTNATKHES